MPDAGAAQLIARAAGVIWLCLGGALVLSSLRAAAVSVTAVVVLIPWATIALALGALLLIRPARRRILIAAVILGTISTVVGSLLLTRPAVDFSGFWGEIIFINLASAGAAVYSLLALWRLRPISS